jgi:hypothetical protein
LKRDHRLRLTKKEHDLIKEYRDNNGEVRNFLCVGDLHEPFCLDGYLEHCLNVYHKYNCNGVIMLGDLIDLHFSSFHTSDPDGYGAGEELNRAVDKIKVWYEHFNNKTVPNGVFVCIGNHDAIIRRKAFESGISKKWVRDYNEVLECPDWDFKEYHKIDGVIYTHGTGTSGRNAAVNKALQFGDSTVQGHIHTESSIIYVGQGLFGMQIGCGVNRETYSQNYAKFFPKTYKIACGVVLNNGKLPILEPLTTLSK